MEGRGRMDRWKGENGRRQGGGWMHGGGRVDAWKGEEGRMECVVCALASFVGRASLRAGGVISGRGGIVRRL